jgi:arylsulfatase A-like enzyme
MTSNIIFILCDDLGYGDVQCNNPDRCRIATPHIDQLRADGIRFTDAHASSAVCTPSRYSILTGRYNWRSRLQHGVIGENQEALIAADRLTVPALLRQSGYHSACIGKWHLGYTYTDDAGNVVESPVKNPTEHNIINSAGIAPGTRVLDGPVSRGFDYHFGFHRSRTMSTVLENDTIQDELRTDAMLPTLGDKACAYIRERAAARDVPFFLYLPLNSPHGPIVPSADWQGRSEIGAYGDFVMETDDVVGRVIDTLTTYDLSDDTLLIFTSDNGCSGPCADAPALMADFGHHPSGGFRGYKADIWEGGHRIPFFARWPQAIAAGSTCDEMICLTDLMATCAEITGATVPPDAGEDSVSFLPLLTSASPRPTRDFMIHHSISGKFAIRSQTWKLELCPGSGGWTAPLDADAFAAGLPEQQLYNMATDPYETENVVAAHPGIVDELTTLLAASIASGRTTSGPQRANDAAVDMRKRDYG